MMTDYVAFDGDRADFSKVTVRGPRYNRKPYCRQHGAMNKITSWGLWRCTAITERGDRHLEIVETCDAACKEVEVDDPVGFEFDSEYPAPRVPPEMTVRTSNYRTDLYGESARNAGGDNQ